MVPTRICGICLLAIATFVGCGVAAVADQPGPKTKGVWTDPKDKTLPEDLMFQETQDRQNFQARYILRHPWQGDANACPEAKSYFEEVAKRQEREAQTLANLTAWDLNDIRGRMNVQTVSAPQWWERLWR